MKLLAFRLCIYGLSALVGYMLIKAYSSGKKVAGAKEWGGLNWELPRHRSLTTELGFGIILTAAVILVWGLFLPPFSSKLYTIHRYLFATPFTITFLIAKFWLKGEQPKNKYYLKPYHAWIAHICIILGVATLITGVIVATQRP